MGLKARLKQTYNRLQFEPGALGFLVNPFPIARGGLYRAIKPLAATMRGRVLDVGCGSKPYAALFPCDEYLGLEIDRPQTRANPAVDLFYDGETIPLPDGSVDGVFSSEVLEHVFEPEPFLEEIHRVLKPGGTLLLTTPFAWDEHAQPWDYARYTSFGLRHLLKRHGFTVRELTKTSPGVPALAQLFTGYLYKITVRRDPYLNLLACALLLAPWNIVGALLGRVLPDAGDFYLDNVVLATREETKRDG